MEMELKGLKAMNEDLKRRTSGGTQLDTIHQRVVLIDKNTTLVRTIEYKL